MTNKERLLNENPELSELSKDELIEKIIKREDVRENDFFGGVDEVFVTPNGYYCFSIEAAIGLTKGWLKELAN